MDTFVTHDQLLIILLLVFIGASIFAYAMLKHAIELRQRTTQIVEDLSIVQGFIDVELAAKLLEQQVAIDAISIVQGLQNDNLFKLNINSDISHTNFVTISNGGLPTVDGYYYPLI